jgi:hypothetical protein
MGVSMKTLGLAINAAVLLQLYPIGTPVAQATPDPYLDSDFADPGHST